MLWMVADQCTATAAVVVDFLEMLQGPSCVKPAENFAVTVSAFEP
jgi:hypothetical protein